MPWVPARPELRAHADNAMIALGEVQHCWAAFFQWSCACWTWPKMVSSLLCPAVVKDEGITFICWPTSPPSVDVVKMPKTELLSLSTEWLLLLPTVTTDCIQCIAVEDVLRDLDCDWCYRGTFYSIYSLFRYSSVKWLCSSPSLKRKSQRNPINLPH